MSQSAPQPGALGRSRRIGPVWLALVALLVQWAAPALHGLELGSQTHACAPDTHPAPSSAPADDHPSAPDHDEADCRVCLAIAQARDGLAPTLVLCVIESAPALWAEARAPARAAPAPTRCDAFPRGPPSLS